MRITIATVREYAGRSAEAAAEYYRVSVRRPNLLQRLAALFILVLAAGLALLLLIPFVLLGVLLLSLGAIAFLVHSAYRRLLRALRLGRDSEGRRNVRVLTPRE